MINTEPTAEQLAQLRGQSVEGSFYLAECGHCGEMYPSNKLTGGEPLFSGDYGECYCPLCGAEDTDIADCGAWGSEAVTAWNYQQKRVEALLDELERKDKRIAELKEDSAELTRFKEVMKKSAEALTAGKPLNLESLFKGELASAMFAMMFAGEFKRSGAKNYLELLYEVPEFGELTVTIQKVEGKTPGQRIAELEARMVSVKPAEQYEDDSALLFTIDLNDDSEDYQTAQWLKELRRRRAAGINLTVEG
ncbi:ead/Ea22-like family protein [Atlantibacter hermannii]|uniref:ead/Ea22-like family protein n=1 Tax=Atlantibacter hermannii TaxID=565 RepID=UPI0020744C1A|nr:ead/Ea22-like family protein [Atlantibacter hermannii]